MISLSSPYAMVVYSPDEISVDKGSSLSITCSTVSKYPGGYFYLMRSNMSISAAKLAYGQAVFYGSTFDFRQVDYIDQGAYTCVFGVNISSVPYYSAPSKSMQVLVSGERPEEHLNPASVFFSLSFPVSVASFPAATALASTSPLSGVLIALLVIIIVVIAGYFVWKRRSRVTGAVPSSLLLLRKCHKLVPLFG